VLFCFEKFSLCSEIMSDERLTSSSKNFTLFPLPRLAACFAFGILSAKFLSLDWQIYLAVGMLFAVMTAVFIKQKFAFIFLFIAFIAVGGFSFQIENRRAAPDRLKILYESEQIKSGDPIEIEGVLQGKPELTIGGFFLEIRSEKAIYRNSEIKVSGKVRLFAPVADRGIEEEYERLNLQYNSIVRFACNLQREDNFINAGVVSQKEILDQKGIDATGVIKSPLLVEKIGNAPTFKPTAWLFNRREDLIVKFSGNFNVSTAGVLIASLLGNRYFLDNRTADVFREGGTFHVLVISGLHVTFIGGLILYFVRIFTGKKLWLFIIAVSLLWAFAVAVGAEIPVARAALMFTILLFSTVIYRRGTLLNALGACALVLLVWRPNDLFTQSFQLTFQSVAALVLIAFPLLEKLRAIGEWSLSAETPAPPRVPNRLKRFCETLYWRENVWQIEGKRNVWTANLFKSPYINWTEQSVLQKIVRYIFEGAVVSLIVQISLLPLMIIYFNRVSFSGILLNLWVGVVIALESFTAVFAVALAQMSDVLAFPFIKITEFFNWLLISIPDLFVETGWASFRVPTYSGEPKALYFLYFAPVLILTILLFRWNPFALDYKSRNAKFEKRAFRFAVLSLAVLSCLIVFHPFSAPAPGGRLQIDFLDVGQGDSAFISFPNGETMLVDGGGKLDYKTRTVSREGEDEEIFEPDTQTIGETVVSKFLWEKGYDKIDYILATHADADHIQGLSDAAKNFRVRAAMFGRTPFEAKEFAAVYAVLKRRDIPLLKLSRGDILRFGGVKIEVLSPEKSVSFPEASGNNQSVVLRVIYGDRKFLLTGDIEKETETELLGAPERLKANVVKVAHHGSRTSSIEEFVDATDAKVAVISVGRKSQFGHPHREVVERWKNAGAAVLTTGERGTVSVSTNGKDLQVKTFLP